MSGKSFWDGETYAIVQCMKARGNQEGVIQRWKDTVAQWANQDPVMDADRAAVISWLPHWQIRPFYTAEELAPMWPALAIAIGFTNKWPAVLKDARRLEFELDYAGLPWRHSIGKKFYIVERLHYWPAATQDEFDNELFRASQA